MIFQLHRLTRHCERAGWIPMTQYVGILDGSGKAYGVRIPDLPGLPPSTSWGRCQSKEHEHCLIEAQDILIVQAADLRPDL